MIERRLAAHLGYGLTRRGGTLIGISRERRVAAPSAADLQKPLDPRYVLFRSTTHAGAWDTVYEQREEDVERPSPRVRAAGVSRR